MYLAAPHNMQSCTHTHTPHKSFIIIKVNLARAAGRVGAGASVLRSEKEGGAGEPAEEKKRTG